MTPKSLRFSPRFVKPLQRLYSLAFVIALAIPSPAPAAVSHFLSERSPAAWKTQALAARAFAGSMELRSLKLWMAVIPLYVLFSHGASAAGLPQVDTGSAHTLPASRPTQLEALRKLKAAAQELHHFLKDPQVKGMASDIKKSIPLTAKRSQLQVDLMSKLNELLILAGLLNGPSVDVHALPTVDEASRFRQELPDVLRDAQDALSAGQKVLFPYHRAAPHAGDPLRELKDRIESGPSRSNEIRFTPISWLFFRSPAHPNGFLLKLAA